MHKKKDGHINDTFNMYYDGQKSKDKNKKEKNNSFINHLKDLQGSQVTVHTSCGKHQGILKKIFSDDILIKDGDDKYYIKIESICLIKD